MDRADPDIREKFQRLTRESIASEGERDQADWEPVISIGTAATIVGLSVSALRKYEKEGLLIYHRSETGRRLLCRSDIKRIKMVQHLINTVGLNIEGIRRLLALLPCWDLKVCSADDKKRCEAVHNNVLPCWMIKYSECRARGFDCRQCEVYRCGAYCATTMKMLLHETDIESKEPTVKKKRPY